MKSNPPATWKLNYASPALRVRKLAFAAIAASVAVASGAVAVYCLIHAIHVYDGLQRLAGPRCGNGVAEEVAKLGLPLERTIPIGVFSGGGALVAMIQAIRFVNGAKRI